MAGEIRLHSHQTDLTVTIIRDICSTDKETQNQFEATHSEMSGVGTKLNAERDLLTV